MKTMGEISNDLMKLYADYEMKLEEPMLSVLTLYVSHEILDARQDVFDMVIGYLEKKGV